MNNKFLIIVGAAVCLQLVSRSSAAGAEDPERPTWDPAGEFVAYWIKQFESTRDRWDAGETNLPTLRVQWFPQRGVVGSVEVSKENIAKSFSRTMRGTKGGVPVALDNESRSKLNRLLNTLPEGESGPPPLKRRVLVTAIREGSLFITIHDRADIPLELEELCALVGVSIEWVVPSTGESFRFESTEPRSPASRLARFSTASRAPFAVSVSGVVLHLWDLEAREGSRIEPTRQTGYHWSAAAVHPEGQWLVAGGFEGAACFHPRTGAVRWSRASRGADRRGWVRVFAFLDGGESLAVALPEGIERWSATTGETLGPLSGGRYDQPAANAFSPITGGFDGVMAATPDGRVLAADMGNGLTKVWRGGWAGPPLELQESDGARLLTLSPDGQKIVIQMRNVRRQERLLIHDVTTGSRTDVPLRGLTSPFSDVSAAAWSPDGRHFVYVLGSAGWPCILETETWKPVLHWRMPDDARTQMGAMKAFPAFANDGRLLVLFHDGTLVGLTPPFVPDEQGALVD